MKTILSAGIASFFTLISTAAFAHHPMGGKTPSTIGEGLLSGIGHPIIGLDHLAFVVAVGVAAIALGSRFMLPLFFIVATMVGTGLHVMSIGLPIVEVMIALSVVLVGFLVMSGRQIALPLVSALFAVAGLFHGHAYGEAIFGAEATPMVAYLAGFALTQYAIAIVAGTLVYNVLGKAHDFAANIPARMVGGMVAGAGMLIVGEQAIGAIFG